VATDLNRQNKTQIIQSNSVTTISSDRPFLFVISGDRYNRTDLCTKMTNFPLKSVRYNQVLVNNRVRYIVITEFYCMRERPGNIGRVIITNGFHFSRIVRGQSLLNSSSPCDLIDAQQDLKKPGNALKE
jgi:hypothetical protein